MGLPRGWLSGCWATRTLRTAGGGSGTQIPALQLRALGRLGGFPQLGFLPVTQGHSTTLFMLPAPPGCHEGKTQAKVSPGEVGRALHTGSRDPGSGLSSVTELLWKLAILLCSASVQSMMKKMPASFLHEW